METKLRRRQRFHDGHHHWHVFRLAAGHHRVDRDFLRGHRNLARRHFSNDLVRSQGRGLQHFMDQKAVRRQYRKSVCPAARETEFYMFRYVDRNANLAIGNLRCRFPGYCQRTTPLEISGETRPVALLAIERPLCLPVLGALIDLLGRQAGQGMRHHDKAEVRHAPQFGHFARCVVERIRHDRYRGNSGLLEIYCIEQGAGRACSAISDTGDDEVDLVLEFDDLRILDGSALRLINNKLGFHAVSCLQLLGELEPVPFRHFSWCFRLCRCEGPEVWPGGARNRSVLLRSRLSDRERS